MTTQIKENTFAEACYNHNSIEELQESLVNGADEVDMKQWELTESEWAENVQLALSALQFLKY